MKKLKNAELLFALCITTVIVFWPSLHGEFLYWDDDLNIILNPILRSHDFIKIWTDSYIGMYIPMIYSAWGWILSFDTDPLLFHIFNICLHIFNLLLVFILLRKLSKGSSYSIIFATALFALHPLQVGTVSWITGGRDLLSASFALLSFHANLSNRRSLKYYLAPLLFGLSLLSKPASVLLPVLLWILKSQAEPKKMKALFVEYIPWGLLALLAFYITNKIQMPYVTQDEPWWTHPLVMMDTYGFYFHKFLWPFHLNTDYGRTPQWLIENIKDNWENLIFCGALILLSLAPSTQKIWRKPILIYTLLLLPVSGIVTFAHQQISTVADHYIYLPVIGLCWGFSQQIEYWYSKINMGALWRYALLFIFVFIYGAASFQRAEIWLSNKSFFESMLDKNSNSFSAHASLGRIAMEDSNIPLASQHVFEAYRLAPQVFSNEANRYIMLQYLGYHQELLKLDQNLDSPYYIKAQTLEPRVFINLLNSLAASLEALGYTERSFLRTCQALHLDSNNSVAKNNLIILKEKLRAKNISLQCK